MTEAALPLSLVIAAALGAEMSAGIDDWQAALSARWREQ